MRGLLMPLLASTFMLVSFSTSAEAAPSCAALNAQLEKAMNTRLNTKAVARYSKAIKKQNSMIAKVTKDIRRLQCSKQKHKKACKQLKNAKQKMQNNLQNLKRQRAKLSGKGQRGLVQSIQAKLDANDCNAQTIIANTEKRESTTIGNGVQILGGSGGNQRSKIVALPNSGRAFGNYRTLCVRTCDGFFFPISSNTNSSSFARDEHACQLMCPGTNTELYFHRAFDQESEEMISYRGGNPYENLPNAFVYRKKFDMSSKSCSCNMSAFHAEMARREALVKGEVPAGEEQNRTVTTQLVPIDEVDPGEDPETRSNRDGGLTDNDIKAVASVGDIGKPLDQTNRKIRIVGPVFLPNENEISFTTQNSKTTDKETAIQ